VVDERGRSASFDAFGLGGGNSVAFLSQGSDSGHRNRRRVMDASLRLRRLAAERICFLELCFDRGASDRRRRRKLCAQLGSLLSAVLTSMDFLGVQTATHERDGSRSAPRVTVP